MSEAKLKAFSSQLQELSYQTPDYLTPHLSDDLVVEVNLGSNAQGVSMFFNKTEYLTRLDKNTPKRNYKEYLKSLDIRTYDHVVTSPTSGRFSVVSFSRATRKKYWGTYEVEIQGDKLKIVRITEEM